MTSILDVARVYHGMGLNVVPVVKKSAFSWGRWQVERQSAEQLAALDWETNVTGLAAIAGPVSDHLVAIDLDGAPGEAPLNTALGRLGLPKEYPWAIKTPGRGGGWHIWLRSPDLWDELEKAGHPAKAVLVGDFPGAEKVELRWKECYTLLPPSEHPDGGRYKAQAKITEAPTVIPGKKLVRLAEWREERKKPEQQRDKPADDWTAYIRKAIENGAQAVSSAPIGERNAQLNAAAYSIARMEWMGAQREHVEAALYCAAHAAGLPEQEIVRTFDSGWSAGVDDPRELPERKEREAVENTPSPEPPPRGTIVTLREALDALEQYTITPLPAGIAFPWDSVNALARPMRPGWLTFLAGYTSHGKTAAAIECALFAGDLKKRVLLISGEMSEDELAVRVAQREGLNSRRFYDGEPSPYDQAAVRKASALEASANISILYCRQLDEIRRHCQAFRPDLLIVDYLQFLDIGRATRLEGTTKNSQGLKDIARRCEVPVLCLSQLRRPDRTMREAEPQLDDLRDSGSIEQDADQVIFIWRKEVLYDQMNRPTYYGKLIVAKARMGGLGSVEYTFDPIRQIIKL